MGSHTHTLTHSDTHTHGVEWWSNQGGEISVGCPVFVLGRPGPHLVTQPPPFTLLFHPPPSLSIGAITQRSSSSGLFSYVFLFLFSLPSALRGLPPRPTTPLSLCIQHPHKQFNPPLLPSLFSFFFYFIYLCI